MNRIITAFINDLAQRVLTFNKFEQRNYIDNLIDNISVKKEANILDFGCGSGLFASVFLKKGMRYFGYDIDEGLIEYCQKLYGRRGCCFSTSVDNLNSGQPFDLILANCCFHHIDDESIIAIIRELKNRLADNGIFLLIDILFPSDDKSILRNAFRKLERGAFIRTKQAYCSLIDKAFNVENSYVNRSHLFSIKGFPVYNDLLVLVCKKL